MLVCGLLVSFRRIASTLPISSVVVSDVERMAQWRSAWCDDVDDDATLQAFHVIGDTRGGSSGGRKGGKGGGGGRGGSGGKGGRGKRGQSCRFKEIEANLRELQPMTLEDRQTLRPPPRLAQFAQKEPDAARLLENIHEDERLWFTLIRHVDRAEETRLLASFGASPYEKPADLNI